jgi:hypothetical protein
MGKKLLYYIDLRVVSDRCRNLGSAFVGQATCSALSTQETHL